MRDFKITTLLFSLFFFSSCGKPPLFNKLDKSLIAVSDKIAIGIPERKISFTLEWIIPPNATELSSFTITLSEALPEKMNIHAYIDMPEMGHGSSPIVMEKISDTRYEFTEISFFMTGLWVLYIDFTENNQAVYKWQKSYTVL